MRTGVTEYIMPDGGSQPGDRDRFNKTYEYDNMNRLIYESSFENGTDNGYEGEYSYDLVGNRRTRTITVTKEGDTNCYIHTTTYNYAPDGSDRLISESYTYEVSTCGQSKLIDLKNH